MPDHGRPYILNVDDNDVGRYATSRILREAGFEVLEAATGREALRQAENHPDLVLLDVNLPDISGLDVCKQLKANPSTATIPVVHLSASLVGGAAQVAGLEQGADGYLTHPIEPRVLVATIHAFLRLKAAEHAVRQSKERLEQYAAALEATNKALEESNRLAKYASRAKSEFMANMSHELRTPLNAVIGFSEGLLDRTDIHPLNEHQKDRLERIKASGEYLLQLINTVLDLAKAESGKMELQITTFDVEPIVRNVGDMAEALIKDKSAIRFIIDMEEGLPQVTSDCDKIRQILINLLGNAVKFTQQGSIVLWVRRSDDSLLFSVADTGVGISVEHLGQVFEQFYQVEQKAHRLPKGTGLGLAISKAFAILLGGTLTVESVQGQGSTFTLSVPWILDRRKGADRRQAVQ